jgi:hypothetical protein
MDKPRVLHSISFSDEIGNMIVNEPCGITFYRPVDIENYIQDRYVFWKDFTGLRLVIAEDSADAMAEIEAGKVRSMVAAYRKCPYHLIRDNSTRREAVEVRRQTVMICIRRKMTLTTISRALHLKHDKVIYYRDTFNDLFAVDKSYSAEFLEMEDYILTELFGKYSDDGSGSLESV